MGGLRAGWAGRWARIPTVFGVLSACLLAPVAVAAASAAAGSPDVPTVTFEETGLPPVSCGSQPDVSSLTVPEGTQIVLENAIGESAWVRVGGEPVIEVADGSGALVTLTVGQHDVRMVPACLMVGDGAAQPVTVTVTAAAPSADPGPTTSPDPPRSPGPSAAGVPGAMVSIPPTRPHAPTPVVVPAGTEVAEHDRAQTTSSAEAFGHAGVVAVTPVNLDRGGNPKGVRLLAVIATICVLGVTAAIIRSIVRLSP